MKRSLAVSWMIVCYAGSCVRAVCLPGEFSCSNGNCISVESQCDRYNDCGDNSDELGCSCYTGDIRLLGGPSAAEGTVELCSLNTWAAICDVYFTMSDAAVICRQLGFNDSISVYKSFYGRGSSIYTWGNVAGGCAGNESTFLSCPRNPQPYTCSIDEFAGVKCSIPNCPAPNFQCANTLCINYNYRCDGYNDCRDNSDETNCTCNRGSIQLVGGASPEEGTVEVCNANRWGTVCDTLWGSNDARVVCNQLGYTNASAPISKSLFGHGSTMTTWNDFGGCRGTESSITSCSFTAPLMCNSRSLAGVRCFDCSGPKYYQCTNARCISSMQRCNHVDDCGDGSDETNCGLPTISSIAFSGGRMITASLSLIGGVVGGVVGLSIVCGLVVCIIIGIRYHMHRRKTTYAVQATSTGQLASVVCETSAGQYACTCTPAVPEPPTVLAVLDFSIATKGQDTTTASHTSAQ